MEITYNGRTYRLISEPASTSPLEEWWSETSAEAVDQATGEAVDLYFWEGKLHAIIHGNEICEVCERDDLATIYAKDYDQDDYSRNAFDRLEIAILEHALNGEDVRVVYPADDYRGIEVYKHIDTEAIERYLGKDLWAMAKADELSCGMAGYTWWENIAGGDQDCIEETIEMYRGYL